MFPGVPNFIDLIFSKFFIVIFNNLLLAKNNSSSLKFLFSIRHDFRNLEILRVELRNFPFLILMKKLHEICIDKLQQCSCIFLVKFITNTWPSKHFCHIYHIMLSYVIHFKRLKSRAKTIYSILYDFSIIFHWFFRWRILICLL